LQKFNASNHRVVVLLILYNIQDELKITHDKFKEAGSLEATHILSAS
jgi:hypothetical protein